MATLLADGLVAEVPGPAGVADALHGLGAGAVTTSGQH
jgi:hypothetical protein